MENKSSTQKITFIYNARSDAWSRILDFGHKILDSQSYACELCTLTHGNFGIKEEWLIFSEKHKDFNFEFLYKNQVCDIEEGILPCILDSTGKILLDKMNFQKIHRLEDLIQTLEEILEGTK